jgi:hypothetical protein
LTRPKVTKSVAITTIARMQVTEETSDARNVPNMPEPRARRNAINAKPQAIGCRIMTRVSLFVVSSEAVLKEDPSI